MQILQFKPPTQIMPSMWEEMCQGQEDEPLQRSVQECKGQHGPQHKARAEQEQENHI